MGSPLIDAQAMHRKHPETFEVPTQRELADISPGDMLKVAAEGERFWCEVEGRASSGEVDCLISNELVNTDRHGYERDDVIEVEPRHVYQIMPSEHWRKIKAALDDEENEFRTDHRGLIALAVVGGALLIFLGLRGRTK